MQDLGSEYFVYDEEALTLRGERSRDVITFGARFDVEVLGVDLSRRQIGFLRASALVKEDPKKKKPTTTTTEPAAWAPRTDARPGPAREQRGGRKKKGEARPDPRRQQREQSRKERRKERVEAHISDVDARRSTGQVDPLPDPHGRGRGEKQRWLAYETALAHVEDGSATPEERIYVEERRAMLSERAHEKYAALREKKQRKKERQQRYDDQQQTTKKAPPKPSSSSSSSSSSSRAEEPRPQAPPKIRGPDDLRALFESRGGGGGNAPKKRSSSKKPAPKKKR
jgi:hypothetical protein